MARPLMLWDFADCSKNSRFDSERWQSRTRSAGRLGPGAAESRDAAPSGESDADTRAPASCSDLHRANSLAFSTPSRSVSDDVPDPVAITSLGGIL